MPPPDDQPRGDPHRLDPADPASWPEILTPDHLAHLLELSRTSVRRKLRDGTLPGRNIGGRWRTSKRRLLEYLEGPDGADAGDADEV